MLSSEILKKNYQLPEFSIKKLSYALLLVFLPNFIFWLIALYTQTARPLINLDYLIVAVLFAFQQNWIKWLGVISFWLAVLFDTLMFIMQLFPFMDLTGAIYLAPFLRGAPLLYQLSSILLFAYLLLTPILLNKIGKKTNVFHTLKVSAVLFIISYFTGHLLYHNIETVSFFGGNNFYYGKSQILMYNNIQEQAFQEASRTEPQFVELKYDRASIYLEASRSDKILFIINESWGELQNKELQNAILEKLYAQQDFFSYFNKGAFRFVGSTLEGEMRELCNVGIKGFALRYTPEAEFSNCLPNQLKAKGYNTYALHGASSLLYDRFSWYKKAGFQYFDSAETMPEKPRCAPFNGVCDLDLFDNIKQVFAKNEKVFYYWLTLTTHVDYPEKDLVNRRLNCEKYGVENTAMLCRNFKLQAQFFDALADLVQKPEMKGVEVIVVGDHVPPTYSLREQLRLIQDSDIAWVHFKVKE